MENPEPVVAQISSSHGNLLEVLNELRGKICFVKEMTASNVRPLDPEGRFLRGRTYPCQLSLPKSFAGAQKTKIMPTCVVLHTGMSNKSWSLRLSHYLSRGEFAKFTSGWRQFVTDNGVVKGNILVFSLTAMSEFQVYIFDSDGLPKTPQMLQASSLTTKIKISQRIHKVLESLGNKREELITEGTENLINKSFVTRLKRTANSDDETTDLTSNAAYQTVFHRNIRYTKAKIVEDSPLKICHDSDLSEQEELVKEEPLSDQEELVMPIARNTEAGISDRNLKLSQKSKVHAPLKAESLLQAASFQKQLAKRNLLLMEIPSAFLKKYGSRLQTHVQLQGTLEGSPVRDVGRVFHMSAGQARCFLKNGWHDFVTDNMLRAGQHILFTLTANSFFEVREVIT